MTNQELLNKIQTGELPSAGILRRAGAAQSVRVTMQVDGQTIDVPDVDLSRPTEEETA